MLIGRILSLIVILLVGYVGAVFAFPDVAARIDTAVRLDGLSAAIRAMKNGIESPANVNPDLSVGTGGIIDRAQQLFRQTASGIENARATIDTKTKELNDVIQSAQQAQESIAKLRENVGALTTVGGVASGSVAASGAVTASGR